MNAMHIKARAKINIALDVLGKRPDGYHKLRMINLSVSLYDDLYIKRTQGNGINLVTNSLKLPANENNLIYKAAKALKIKYGIKDGLEIELEKRIPISAGLGGGSSDAAAALIGIKQLFDLPVSDPELMEIGRTIGADVPYCMMGGTALVEGTGEILTRLSDHPMVTVLLCKPIQGLSTATVFKSLDLSRIDERPDIASIITSIENSDTALVAGKLCNVLEKPAFAQMPVIKDIKETLLTNGAMGAVMSGSGSSVLAYFISEEAASEAAELLITKCFGNLPTEERRKFRTENIFITKIDNSRQV